MSMEESTTPSSPDASNPALPTGGAPVPPPPEAPKRNRHWLRIVVLGVVALLILLVIVVALLPTIASTGWARSMVVGKVNQQINGRLEIADWSFGWGGNIRVDDVRLFDDQNRQILNLAHFTGGKVAIWDVVGGKYNLGKFTVDGLNFKAERDTDGVLNFQKLSKKSQGEPAPGPVAKAESKPQPQPQPESPPKPATKEKPAPQKLPELSVEFALVNSSGTYADLQKKQTIALDSLTADVKIPNINAPIENQLTVVARVNNGAPGTIDLRGKILAVHDNQPLTADQIAQLAQCSESLALTDLDLASLSPFFAPGSALSQMAGKSVGRVTITAEPNQGAKLNAQIACDDLHIGNLRGTKFSANADGLWDDKTFKLGSKAYVQTLVNEHPAPGAQANVLSNWLLTIASQASIGHADGGSQLTLDELQIGDSEKLFNVAKSSDGTFQLVSGADGVVSGAGKILLNADLVKINNLLRDLAAAPAKGAPKADASAAAITLTSGQLAGDITFASTPDRHLNVSTNVAAKDVAFNARKNVPEDPAKPKGPTRVQHVDHALGATDFTTSVVIETGAGKTVAEQIHQLVLSQLSAHVAGAEVSLKRPLTLTDLVGLSQTPKSASESKSSLSAPLNIKGDLTPAFALLDALAAEEPGTKYPYSGTFNIDEGLGTLGSAFFAKGAGDITNFQVHDAKTKAVSFTEPTIHLSNDVQASAQSVSINDLSVAMVGSKALSLAIKGNVDDLAKQRLLQQITADLTYDLASLWKIIYPTLSAEDQKAYKDAQLAGQFTKHFTVNGSYPANVPFEQAVKNVIAQGGLSIGSFKGRGLDLHNLEVPLFVKNGVATVANSDKPGDYAKPAALNTGELSLGGIAVDLTDPHPRLNTPANLALLKGVALNATLADALGEKVGNFLFQGAQQATGILTIIITKCEKFPLDKTATQAVPSNDGYLALDVSISNLTLASPSMTSAADKFSSALQGVNFLGNNQKLAPESLRGDIKSYKIVISHGITSHDMTLAFGENQRPLHLAGDVNMQSQAMKMNLELPLKLLGLADPKLDALMPNGISLPIGGTVSAPQFDVSSAVQKTFTTSNPQDLLKKVGGLLNNGKKPKQNGSTQPADQNSDSGDSALNALQGLLGGKGKSDKPAPDNNPATAPGSPPPSSPTSPQPSPQLSTPPTGGPTTDPSSATQPAADNTTASPDSEADQAISALQGLLDKQKKKKKPKKAQPATATAPATE